MQILRRLDSLRAREHGATVELISALCACHRTRAYADAGYGSVWQLLVKRLRYSPAAASRRNAAMRCALRFPVVLDMLREHRTTLSALHKIEKTLLAAGDPSRLLAAMDGATQDEIERLVAQARPVPMPVERVQRAVVRRASSGAAMRQPAARVPATNASGAPAPAVAAPTVAAPTVAESPEHRIRLSFSLTEEEFAKLECVKARLSNKRPAGMTLEQVFDELMDFYLSRKSPPPTKDSARPQNGSAAELDAAGEAKQAARPSKSAEPVPDPSSRSKAESRSRHVPAAVRRAVFHRDGHRCTFTARDGTCCESPHDLELDHIVPYACGGTHDPSNLRVLCRTHNHRRAEVEFGVPLRNDRRAGP